MIVASTLIRRHFGTKCPMGLHMDKEEKNGRVASSESESIPYVGWLVGCIVV